MHRKRYVWALAVLCIALLIAGCGAGGGGKSNRPPQITSFSPAEEGLAVPLGGSQAFSVTASDPDGDQLAYAWRATAGTFSAENAPQATWTAPAAVGQAEVKVTVSDGKSVASVKWDITVSPLAPPTISDTTPASSEQSPVEVYTNQAVTLAFSAVDPQGLELTSTWSCTAGELQDEELEGATWVAPSTAGPASVTVTVTNGTVSASHTWFFDVQHEVSEITQDITSATTWQAGKVYVINCPDYNLRITDTLTIEPGVIVKFADGKGIILEGTGKLVAKGTAQQPIIFTSIKDDAHGGDTNSDLDATAPVVGSWGIISLSGSDLGNEFEYCQFYYGGKFTSSSILDLKKTEGTSVVNCVIAFSNGLALTAKEAKDPIIQNNTFFGNRWPLEIHMGISLDDSNTFHNPSAPDEKNIYQGISVYRMTTHLLTKHVTWGETEAAFLLMDGLGYEVGTGGKLTLEPGTTVKFGNSSLSVSGGGIVEAKGTALSPVVFTSYKDDAYGGESNGPDSEEPQPGDWKGVVIWNNGEGVFEHCIFRYGGTESHPFNGSAALKDISWHRKVEVKDTTFEHNLRGLDLLSPLSTVTDCVFIGNHYPLRVSPHADTDNTLVIKGNTYDAIYLHGVGEGFLKEGAQWLNTAVPYVLMEDAVLDGVTVQLAIPTEPKPGATLQTVVRVWQGLKITLVNGGSFKELADGIFTSYLDDYWGGDVGQGPGRPGDEDWEGIWDEDAGKWLKGDNILYAAHP